MKDSTIVCSVALKQETRQPHIFVTITVRGMLVGRVCFDPANKEKDVVDLSSTANTLIFAPTNSISPAYSPTCLFQPRTALAQFQECHKCCLIAIELGCSSPSHPLLGGLIGSFCLFAFLFLVLELQVCFCQQEELLLLKKEVCEMASQSVGQLKPNLNNQR